MARTVARVTLVVLALTAAVACGEDDDSTSTPGSEPPPSAGGRCTFDGETAPVEQAPPTETLALVDVRMAGHECFDRIVFEFRGTARPGFEVQYLDGAPVEDPTGNAVEVAGTAFLEIRMQSASGFDFEANTPSYDGPNRLTPTDTIYAREAARTGDFEAILIWVVGLDEERPFTASTLADPARVVVDIG
jgi:hypothetical protein